MNNIRFPKRRFIFQNTNAEKSEVRTTTSAKNFENFEKEARLRETLKRLEDERTCKVSIRLIGVQSVHLNYHDNNPIHI